MTDPAKIAERYAQHLVNYPDQLRLLDTGTFLSRSTYAMEPQRNSVIAELGAQIARDAFKRGLGVLELSDPLYRVHVYLGRRDERDDLIQDERLEPFAPSPSVLGPQDMVEIRLEAVTAPIWIRGL